MASGGTVNRKATSHSSYSSTSASNLDNNLDALLDDLQTSITSKNASTPQHSSTRLVETSTRRSPLRSTSPLRSISPSQGRTTTVEKYVSTGPAGTVSGIPGLEMLDAELQDVQPGQSKTVAYKQVSYHYDKSQEGQDLEPWMKTTNKLSKNDASIVDEFCERTFEKQSSPRLASIDTPDFAKSGQEIIYKADVSSRTIPTTIPITETRSTERDFKYEKKTSYHTEPSPISPRKNIKTVRTDETEELTNVEYIPASTPIPANLAPGPNTKVTTTIKTYTYELPGAPETYLPPPSTTTSHAKNVAYHVEEQKSGYLPSPSPTGTSSRVHREEKVYREERRAYRPPSPPPVTTTTVTRRNEQYLQQSSGYTSSPVPVTVDYPDRSLSRTERTERILYENESSGPGPLLSHPQQPPPPQHSPSPVTEGTRTTIKQYEEHYTSSRPPKPSYFTTTTDSQHSSSHHVYKYDEQSLLPKPFPTSERPASPRQQPPKRVEDLMASFSDSEEVVEVLEKRERKTAKEIPVKKEVDFVPHTPPVVKSKNIAGPPVYYPPGSGEFTKKEESMAAMSKASGGWAKERAAWEYGASSKSEEKVKTKKAVVPICLPLCCALPCVIM